MNEDVSDENPDGGTAEHLGQAMHQLFIRAIGNRSAINARAEAARFVREMPMIGKSEDDIRKEIVAGAIARGIPVLM
ncbi:hypothetical protein [Chelatococcus asaccharovorans]|uniref:hypothetical protein n=1 Tax=Chelatococcus asaccharovorans TaxID=28210 RepID=UPI00224C7563|nr:hypothetical protein [Chelatococcus asaccharovorans]CAH1657475.1 conserved hypothetical protein [Chelatococcus asaccharovorans]CAH1687683.1 conserved hypothetical protein [Chelatococcus asaccharovorans]